MAPELAPPVREDECHDPTSAGFERRFERMVAERNGAPVPDVPSEADAATRMVGPPMPRHG
jgi:hypothetical protein